MPCFARFVRKPPQSLVSCVFCQKSPTTVPGSPNTGPLLKNGGKIGDGGLVRLDGSPVGGSLRSPRRLTASINVTKAREILSGNCRCGPKQSNGQNARRKMVHTAPRLHRLVRQCHGTEDDCDKASSTVDPFRAYLRTKLLQPTTHAQRYAATRQTNGLSIVKPTAMFETTGPWVSMVC